MANSKQILNKIARDASMLGLTVSSHTASSLVITDAVSGFDILIAYEDAQIQDPMGGIDPTVSPFLGIGTANPGKIVFGPNAAGNKTLAQIFPAGDVVAPVVFALCARFANNVLIVDGNEGLPTSSVLVEIDGDADLKSLGQ